MSNSLLFLSSVIVVVTLFASTSSLVSAEYLFTVGADNVLYARTNSSSPTEYVCDDGWTGLDGHNNAVAFCRFAGSSSSLNRVYYSTITSPDYTKSIGLDDVKCPAGATSFESNCTYSTTSNCGPSEAITLFCNGRPLQTRFTNTQKALQLAPAVPSATFENVAFQGMTKLTAEMICIISGYDVLGSGYNVTFWNLGTGNVAYYDMSCSELATSVSDCTFNYAPRSNIPGYTGVGIDCGTQRKNLEFSIGPQNLLLSRYIGTSQWMTVCDDGFAVPEAQAIANSIATKIGYPLDNVEASYWVNTTSANSGVNYPIGFWNVDCPTNSDNFTSPGCIYQTNPNCNMYENIYMSITPVIRPDYRFWIGGNDGPNILYTQPVASLDDSSTKGAVCDDNFDSGTAQKLCSFMYPDMTDFSKVLWWRSNLDFASHSDLKLVLSDVHCKNNAVNFQNCTRKTKGNFFCSVSEAVALTCDGTGVDFDLRIGDGSHRPGQGSSDNTLYTSLRGTNSFKPVGANSMNEQTATAICSALGYTNTSAFRWWTDLSSSATTVFMDNIVCPSSITGISNCNYSLPTGNDAVQRPAQIDCGLPRLPFQFSLLDNNTRLLLFKEPGTANGASQKWMSTCDDGMNTPSAQLLCRVLGYGDGSKASYSIMTAPSNYPIGLESVICPADAQTFYDCSYATEHDCTSREAVSLNCNTTFPELQFMVEPETSRLLVKEVGVDADYGNVCNDYFSDNSARTICKTIHGANADLSRLYWFTDQNSKSNRSIVMSDIECPTAAADSGKFSLCTYNLLNRAGDKCRHNEDVVLSCFGTWLDIRTQVTSSATQVMIAGSTTRWSYIGANIDQSAANVVCKEHGYINQSAFTYSILKNYAYDMLIDNVTCPIGAETLSECDYIINQSPHSYIRDVASIQCGTQRAPWTFAVDKNNNGLVIAYPPGSNRAMYIGVDGFNSASAFFICNKTQSMIGKTASYGMIPTDGRPLGLKYVECPTSGTPARTLDDCSPTEYPAWSFGVVTVNCDIPITSTSTTTPAPGVSTTTPSPNSSNLPFYFDFPDPNTSPLPAALLLVKNSTNGQTMGTACSDWFNLDTARTLCRLMNRGDGTRVAWTQAGQNFYNPSSSSGSSSSTSSIAADNIECPPSATSLSDCSFVTGNAVNCESHNSDILLYCDAITQLAPIEMKTAKYNGDNVLRVDIGASGYFGAVQYNSSLPQNSLECICEKLGYKPGGNFSQKVIPNYPYHTTMINTRCTDLVMSTSTTNAPVPASCHSDCIYGINYNYSQVFDVMGIDCGTEKQDYSFTLKSNNVVVKAPTDQNFGPICATQSFRLDTARYLCRKKLGYEMTTNMNVKFWLGDATTALGTNPYPVAKLGYVDCPVDSNDDFAKACFYDTFASCNLSTNALFIDCNAPVEPPEPELRFRIGESNGVLEGFNSTTAQWGSVCSDYFDVDTAIGVCKILGLYVTGSTPSFYVEGNGAGNLMVSDLVCPSNAASVDDCSYTADVGCEFERAVHLDCGRAHDNFTFAIGANGLLLAKNNNSGVTGTVCNDGPMTSQTAQQICRLAGYSSSSNIEWWTLATYSSLPVVLDSVNCPYALTTNFWSQCNYSQVTDCTNLESVALSCGVPETPALRVEFALGTNNILLATATGSVQSGFIKSTSFNDNTAKTVCSWMGYTDTSSMTFSTTTVTSRFNFFEMLSCSSANASRIHDCVYQLGREKPSAVQEEVVVLNCGSVRTEYSLSQDAQLRVRVASPSGANGTMCSDGATLETVRGICSILGQRSSSNTPQIGWWTIGGATGNILLDNMICNSTAQKVSDCSFETSGNVDCTHDEDLAVACDTSAAGLFSFMIASSPQMGHDNVVLVSTPGSGGSFTNSYVCADTLDVSTATGLCSIMGLSGGTPNFTSFANNNINTIGIRSIECPAGATSIFDCQFSQAGHCSSSLMLSCNQPPPATPSPPTSSTPAPTSAGPRLRIGSNGYLQGYDVSANIWSPVCSDYFDADTASGICGILGLSRSSPTFSNDLAGVNGSLPISDIVCPADANSTSDCVYNLAPGCTNGERAVKLSCEQVRMDFSFKIDPSRGNLLLATRQSDNTVGTVCNDLFTQTTAAQICKFISPSSSAVAKAWTVSSYATLPVVLDNVVCPQGATDFKNGCQYAINSDCSNLEAIALSCDGAGPNVTFSQTSSSTDLMVTAHGSISATYIGGTTLDSNTQMAVCKMLGFTDNIQPTVGTKQVSTRYTLLSNLVCLSTATSLSQCTSYVLGTESDVEQTVDVVTLNCGPNAVRDDYKFSLDGSRVRVLPPGSSVTGTICSDQFTSTSAQGLCKIITGKSSPNAAFWNQRGPGSIVMESVVCPANASKISDCSFSTSTDCSHDEDLGLVCDSTIPGLFKFKTSSSSSSKDILIDTPNMNNSLVCGDFIDSATATVIGTLATGTQQTEGSCEKSTTPVAQQDNVAIKSISCPITAKSIFDCSFSQTGACSSTLRLDCTSSSTQTQTQAQTTSPASSSSATTSVTSTQPGVSTSSSTTSTSSVTPPPPMTTTTTTAVPSVRLTAHFNGTFNATLFRTRLLSIITVTVDELQVATDSQHQQQMIITITGTNAEAAAKQLENLTPEKQQEIGFSNFAPAGGEPNSNDDDDAQKKKNMKIVIGASVGAGVFLLGIVIFMVVQSRNRRAREAASNEEPTHSYFDHSKFDQSKYSKFGETELNESGPSV